MATNIETFLSVYLMIFLKTFVNFRDCNNQTHTKTPTLWSIYKSLNTKALHGGEGGGDGGGDLPDIATYICNWYTVVYLNISKQYTYSMSSFVQRLSP